MSLKKKWVKFQKTLLEKQGFYVNPAKNTNKKNDLIYRLYRNIVPRDANEGRILSLVFSKDRAMQLHAFLSSYYQQVKNYDKMAVIYLSTSESHKQSYLELIEEFKGHDIDFIAETAFKNQLDHYIESCKSEYSKIIFYVDDMIFTHAVDYNHFKNMDLIDRIVCISRGQDMDYSFVLNKKQPLPPFKKLDNDLLEFNWDFIPELTDWTYPLGVSGYMYQLNEILNILKLIEYKAPNSLEAGMQFYKDLFIKRKGICYSNTACSCIHANLVQTEYRNRILNTFSIEELLDLWNQGMRIQIDKFYNKQVNVAQIQKYEFYKKS